MDRLPPVLNAIGLLVFPILEQRLWGRRDLLRSQAKGLMATASATQPGPFGSGDWLVSVQASCPPTLG